VAVLRLQKISQDGEPYQRRPQVEQLISELIKLTPDDIVQKCTDYSDPIPEETLLYVLRDLSLSLKERQYEAVFKALFSRLEVSLKKLVSDAKFIQAADIRQEIMCRMAEMIATDRKSGEEKLDYYEVNFNHAFACLRKDVLRDMGPAKDDPLEKSGPLTKVLGDESEVLPVVEERVREFYELGASKLDDPSFRSALYDAINNLPDDERHVVGLMLKGMQVEAKDPNVQTISKILGCSDRTVRNRLRRAYTKLREVLLVEEEQ
jgi:RNA polymerase sigma factor (sigma-70 family)